MSRVLQNIDPHPISARRVCPPPATKAGGTHSPGGEGGGGSIFWKTRDIGLASYSNNLSTVKADSGIGSHTQWFFFGFGLWMQASLPSSPAFLHSFLSACLIHIFHPAPISSQSLEEPSLRQQLARAFCQRWASKLF
jgi:hypothetical protein